MMRGPENCKSAAGPRLIVSWRKIIHFLCFCRPFSLLSSAFAFHVCTPFETIAYVMAIYVKYKQNNNWLNTIQQTLNTLFSIM